MDETNDLQNQIYNTLDLKETDELLQIWKTNDRSSWSDEAFQAIKKILEQRLGTVPAQDAEEVKEEAEEAEETEGVEEEDKTSKWLLWISSLADVLSYLTLVFFILSGLIPVFGSTNITNAVLTVVASIISGLIYFVILQFISKVIPVLLDIRDYTGWLVDKEEDSN
jgi:uncharacterized membrane protein YdbT with pleckstrin-like domain